MGGKRTLAGKAGPIATAFAPLKRDSGQALSRTFGLFVVCHDRGRDPAHCARHDPTVGMAGDASRGNQTPQADIGPMRTVCITLASHGECYIPICGMDAT